MHGSRLMPEPASSTDFVYLGQIGRAAGPFDSTRTSRSVRHGFTIIEMIVSTVLLSAVMVTALPLFGWIIQQRRSADQRQFAVQEHVQLLVKLPVRIQIAMCLTTQSDDVAANELRAIVQIDIVRRTVVAGTEQDGVLRQPFKAGIRRNPTGQVLASCESVAAVNFSGCRRSDQRYRASVALERDT